MFVKYLSKNDQYKSFELISDDSEQTKIIDLKLNSDLINHNAVLHYINANNESFDGQTFVKIQNEKSCLYHGQIRNVSNSLVALSACNGLVILTLNIFDVSLNHKLTLSII